MVDQLTIPVGSDTKSLIDDLSVLAVKLLADSDESVRENAIRLCAEIGSPLCVEALLAKLMFASGGDLLVICNALGQHKAIAGPMLLNQLEHTTDPKKRDTYLQALDYVACPEILQRIVGLYEWWIKLAAEHGPPPPSEFNRFALVEAINKIKTMYRETIIELILALATMIHDPSAVVRAGAIVGLTARVRELSLPKVTVR